MKEQNIVEEFNNADSTQQQILIMAHFGRAIFYAQILEQQCVNMLAIHELSDKAIFSKNDVEEVFNKYDFSKQTLGSFSKLIAKIYDISLQDIDELNEVIRMRNHYTHNYFRFNDILFCSPSGQLRIIKDCFRFTEKVKNIDFKLDSYTSKYNVAHGITEEKLLSLVQRVKEKWGNEEIDESYDSKNKNN